MDSVTISKLVGPTFARKRGLSVKSGKREGQIRTLSAQACRRNGQKDGQELTKMHAFLAKMLANWVEMSDFARVWNSGLALIARIYSARCGA